MKKFISVISFTILLCLSHQLVCSELNDFSDCTNIVKSRPKPKTRLTYKPVEQNQSQLSQEPQLESTLQVQSQQSQASSIFTSPQAQFAAQVTSTVVTTIAKSTYDVGAWAVNKAINAYSKQNNEVAARGYMPQTNQNPSCVDDDDYDGLVDHLTMTNNVNLQEDGNSPGQKNFNFFMDVDKLKNKLAQDPVETIATLDATIDYCFNKENPALSKNQERIDFILKNTQKVAQQTDEPFMLSALIAKKNKDKQKSIFLKKLHDQIIHEGPRVIQEYEHDIAQAKMKQERALQKMLEATQITGNNFCYMDNCSGTKTEDPVKNDAIKIQNIKNAEDYGIFLKEKNVNNLNQPTTPEQIALISLHDNHVASSSNILTHGETPIDKGKKRNK